MSDALIGYLEGAFLLLAIVLIGWIAWRSFRPESRAEMEDAGRIPFAKEFDDVET